VAPVVAVAVVLAVASVAVSVAVAVAAVAAFVALTWLVDSRGIAWTYVFPRWAVAGRCERLDVTGDNNSSLPFASG
jgi:hypothetical protein